MQHGPHEAPDLLVYAPFVFDPARVALEPKTSSADLAHEFDQLFAQRTDPWDYGSDYEQRKYDDTLALIPENVDSAIEIGCAEGRFTVRLAHRAGRLAAIDISQVALDRARERCALLQDVEFLRLDVFSEPVPGEADLVVCSEMLYYAPTRKHLSACDRSDRKRAQARRDARHDPRNRARRRSGVVRL